MNRTRFLWVMILSLILGFAGPVLDPEPGQGGSEPLLVLMDGTWALLSFQMQFPRLGLLLSFFFHFFVKNF